MNIYNSGEDVSFYLGDLLLGTVSVASEITPRDLFENEQAALNLARLLQTLDSDGNPENGITINEDAVTAFSNVVLDFTSEDFVGNAQDAIGQILINEDEARNHLDESMASLQRTTQNFKGTTQEVSFTEDTAYLTATCVTRYGATARAATWQELNSFITNHPNDTAALLENFFMGSDSDKVFINSNGTQWGNNGRYMINREGANEITLVELNDDTWRGVACFIGVEDENVDENASKNNPEVVELDEVGCENPKVTGELQELEYAQADEYCQSLGARLPIISELETIYYLHNQAPPPGFENSVAFWSTSPAPLIDGDDEEYVFTVYLNTNGVDFSPEPHHTTGSRSVMCVETQCYNEPQIVPEPEEEAAALTLSNFGLTSAVDLFSSASSIADITTNCAEMYEEEGSRAANWSELNEFMTANPDAVSRILENFQMDSDGDKAFVNNADLQGSRYMINRDSIDAISFTELDDGVERRAVCYRP